MIDRHLGVDYPQYRREMMFRASERAKQKLRNPVTYLGNAFSAAALKRMFKDEPGYLKLRARVFAEEFARRKALPIEEIVQFLGEEAAPLVRKLRAAQP